MTCANFVGFLIFLAIVVIGLALTDVLIDLVVNDDTDKVDH